MAILASNSSGNFTAAGTWSVIDPTSYLNTEANSTATTTSFVSSAAFTPGAITIDGIGLRIASRSASPTGTFSVRVAQAGVGVAGTTVTVNVADITLTPAGFYFFKFTAPVTLAAATAYTVQVTSSTVSQVTVYRSATAGDWSRFLRTTTNAAPAATDETYTIGELISAGVSNTNTVTMNNTASTVFGKVEVSGKGVLDFGTSASTAYVLNTAANILVGGAGTLNVGTQATPVPASSSAVVTITVASNVQFGMNCRGEYIVNMYGATKNTYSYLAADAAAAATSFTTQISTGWLSGDEVVLASTTRTAGQTELQTLSANASGATVSTSALGFAHSGTSGTRAEVINLTRNVKFQGTSTTLQTYITLGALGTVNLGYTEYKFLGSATANLRGIDIATGATGSLSMVGCSLRNFEVANSIGINLNSTSNANIIIDNNVYYRCQIAISTAAFTANTVTINNCVLLSTLNTTNAAVFTNLTGTVSNITIAGSLGLAFNIAGTDATTVSYSNLVSHSNATIGLQISTLCVNTTPVIFSNIITYRNTTRGMIVSASGVVFDGGSVFGNATNGIEISTAISCIFKSYGIVTDVSFGQPVGVALANSTYSIFMENCSFGVLGLVHTTGDISVITARTNHQLMLRNCTLASTTEVANQANLLPNAYISSARNDTTSGQHKMWKRYGTITSDTSFFYQYSPSQRLTPNSSTNKLLAQDKLVAVPSGKSIRITVAVRKSVAGDGSAYNGAQPRLIVKANAACGIATDTVIATATNAANGAFEVITGTTAAVIDDCGLCFYIDCDGTTGWTNVDAWRVEIV